MTWDEDTSITVTVVGGAPALGEDDHEPVMLVDGARLAAAGGVAVPNTVWANGPRAGTVLTKEAGPSADVTLRSDVLHDRQSAPLAAGLQHLAEVSVAVLLLWGLLSVLLGAATSAPARGETLARLRTLGLRPAEARRVATGELLPPVLLGAVAGVLLGVLLAHAVLGRLALRLITGQTADPTLVLPWVIVVPVLILLVAVLAVVRVEASLSRRERLGEVLRAGNT
jgi:putative ABC transport system permease protein